MRRRSQCDVSIEYYLGRIKITYDGKEKRMEKKRMNYAEFKETVVLWKNQKEPCPTITCSEEPKRELWRESNLTEGFAAVICKGTRRRFLHSALPKDDSD